MDLSVAKDMLLHTPIARFFDAMAARLNGPRAEGSVLKLNFIFTDLNESHSLFIENSVLHHRKGEPDKDATVTLKVTHDLFLKMALNQARMRAGSVTLGFTQNLVDCLTNFS
jgi:alkyl sulfatase BDS1-like metallo-beta-lactamase superfamily hydrolase